jgi:hypothetical protein
VCAARTAFRASGVNSATGRSAYSVVESLVTSFRVRLYGRRERSFGWGESTLLPPGKCVPPPRLLRAFGGEFGAMAKTATGVHCGFGRVGLSRPAEEAALYSGRCGASCRAGGSNVRYETAVPARILLIRLRPSHCAISLPLAVVAQGDIHKHVTEGSLETDHQRFGVFTALVAFVGGEQ